MIVTEHVDLGARSYDVRIGSGLLARAGAEIAPLLERPRVAVITEENVAALHLEALERGLRDADIAMRALVLPPGEGTKSWETLTRSVEWLLAEKVERGDIVLAFGGGVIGDLAGFAAAVLRRGVRFVQLPTTLLAQVDSSVGGKTGINSPQGKNLVGAFHQPALVLADTDVLDTLARRDFLSGYGEVVKYGLLGDAQFFDWLEANGPALAAETAAPDAAGAPDEAGARGASDAAGAPGAPGAAGAPGAPDEAGAHDLRRRAVRRAVRMKADIVARDETERGERALLNLGHTFCHALEAATGYGERLLHGEGVAIGCALALETSARLGLCAQEEPGRLRAHLRAMGMKTDLCDIPGELPDAPGLLELMRQDKKVVAGALRFVLVRGIGKAFVSADVDETIVLAVLEEALAGRPRG